MAPFITLVYHHMGRLERDPNGVVKYNGGLVINIDGVNPNTCNFLKVDGLILDLGYSSTKAVYWLVPELDLDNGLRLLETDEEVANMCNAASKNGNRIYLYLEHPIIADLIVAKQVIISNDETVDQHEKDNKVVNNEVQGKSNEDEMHMNTDANHGLQNGGPNTSSGQGHNEDSNVEVRQRKGWKPRKKFPRPPPSGSHNTTQRTITKLRRKEGQNQF
ncbi:hypothetical protein PIB30_088777 [Stylosanthes scabra]|uniref:PB1-like domain-containing protein n=1 Tax=Stylosanthes scabra TaxID=79078 RepID=A0ABU6RUI7_9FABA|nr:hypothetical protein [Stylosanthes scabra]